MTQSSNFNDKDSQSLRQMFDFQKQKIISILEEKLLVIKTLTAEDCCDISLKEIVRLRSNGKSEWDTFVVLAGRIVARKNALEAQITQELVRERHKERPDLRGQGQGGA